MSGAAVIAVSPSGFTYADDVIYGTKWASNSLTYSFPTDPSYYGTNYGSGEPTNGFQAFTPVQQAEVQAVLANYSAIANLTFTQITETSTQHATLRFAESNTPSTAWGYYPSTGAAGGDSWYNNSTHWYDNPVPGNYAYSVLMHEIGHNLGLKHPQEQSGAFGIMPLDHDSLEYSVMSYRSYIGASTTSGYTNAPDSYPQSLMMDDIAAIQQLYGAKYTPSTTDVVYKWDPNTGQESINGVGQAMPAGNRVFLTVWDGSGHGVYDFSNYATNQSIDLRPGDWSTISAAQLADLGNGNLAHGNIANAFLYQNNPASLIYKVILGTGSDTVVGNAANNVFVLGSGGGNDTIDGQGGTNTVVFSGAHTSYNWVQNADGSWTITDLRAGSPNGIDTLKNIEILQFTDGNITIGATTTVNNPPVITSPAQTGSIAESSNASLNVTHTASNTITYSDPDTGETHTATFKPEASGYVGAFSINTSAIDTTHSVGWSFSVSDSAISYLAPGQSITELYDVTINDSGLTAMQTVAITITGTTQSTTTTTGGSHHKKAPPPAGGPAPSDTDQGVGDTHNHAAQLAAAPDNAPAPAAATPPTLLPTTIASLHDTLPQVANEHLLDLGGKLLALLGHDGHPLFA